VSAVIIGLRFFVFALAGQVSASARLQIDLLLQSPAVTEGSDPKQLRFNLKRERYTRRRTYRAQPRELVVLKVCDSAGNLIEPTKRVPRHGLDDFDGSVSPKARSKLLSEFVRIRRFIVGLGSAFRLGLS
jgi:hypothetical protein